ncbi:MAG: response regulator transcription factor [Gammaproteobacteria bacterium]|nr:response regulator transcription factor [Gammaproteobacteria bacterium]MDH4256098.1 response regulator transcription factor [Gammaproteobacteria bacterium]MDH5310232.1 response regulator transcription factor [Gammaproteobacteria bacterium]
MDRKLHILVVEDEAAIREGLADVLVYHGYAVELADTGTEGLAKALTGKYDLVLLDIMLPGIDGFRICDRIREQDREQPIIMLTARSSDEDIVEGLKLGADDYVAKPFSVQQLVLRIEAVLRRSRAGLERTRTILLEGVSIDTENLSGLGPAGDLTFTRREIEILAYLASHPDRPVPRDELLVKVWGYARNLDIETRTVDIHIAKLRRKIEADPAEPRNLVTVRGAGYRLQLAEP